MKARKKEREKDKEPKIEIDEKALIEKINNHFEKKQISKREYILSRKEYVLEEQEINRFKYKIKTIKLDKIPLKEDQENKENENNIRK